MTKNEILVKSALDYLAKGFSIIPVYVKTKQPLIPWEAYQHSAMSIPEAKGIFTRCIPENIGIAIITGKISNLAVLDFDGEEALNFYYRKFNLPLSPIVKTPRGYHAYFSYIDGLESVPLDRKLGIDLRADNGYVIAPPSTNYSWVDGDGLDDIPVLSFPKNILFKGV